MTTTAGQAGTPRPNADGSDGDAPTRAGLPQNGAEDRFRYVASLAPVGILEADSTGKITFVNDRWRQITGCDQPVPLSYEDILEFVHPDDRDHLNAINLQARRDKREFDSSARLIRPNGDVRHVRMQGVPIYADDDDDTILGYVGTLIDLTEDLKEHNRAQEALRESESRQRAIIDSLHDGLIVHTGDSVLTTNASASRILGLDAHEMLQAKVLTDIEVLDVDGTPVPIEKRPSIMAFISGEPLYDVVQGIRVNDGELRWFLTNSIPIFHDGDQKPYAIAFSFADITETKKATDALHDSEIKFRTLAESLPVGVYRSDALGTFEYANPRLLEISDLDSEDALPRKSIQSIHSDDRDRVLAEIMRSLRKREPYHVQYRIVTKNGSIRWLNGRGSYTFDPGSADPTGLVGSIEDITPLIAAQEESARLAGIVESTSDLVGIVEFATNKLIYMNRAARELYGFGEGGLEDVTFRDILTPEGALIVERDILPAFENEDLWSGELPMQSADGSTILVWQTIAVERNSDGEIYNISAVGRDVTERRQFEEDLAYRATHDDLTDLPNRALMLDHLDLALARAKNHDRFVALLFLDLDRFKHVNDTLGHDAGDELLALAAVRIKNVLSPGDTVARLGGDEFVILADDVDDENHAIAIAQRISASIESAPFLLNESELDVTASIGIALSRGDEHPEALLRDADAAMYRAKDMGRARLELFDESMRARAARRNELANQLAVGVENDDIVVYYQPCVDLSTGRITSVEALARWQHAERGILLPYEFITLAEETGLIVGLGLNILSRSCRQARVWERKYGRDAPSVHVNLSARQLSSSNLPALVDGVLTGSGLTASKLCLEITESVLMEDAASVIDTLWELKALGVTIAIDDFGTGYSSLSYLRRFPVDVLKVDQSFVAGLGPDPEDSAIVAAIVNLARTLDLHAVAEGVETREQLERLVELGCNAAQGFLFAEPRPADEIELLFEKPFEI